ncbi:hypothetical protein QBC32DRAFT_211984 [Pseudoneurospora amorphoporcata]|uniref:Uncharacterized protein n=1 Tax=Pseudoneurospora amorphoporcata TaxID=241081 RepID=A0AAN6SGI8_9PEZI|nr:hypothetical protein QBC32DRAFT_211984 [Pseudoneurospora amorphoporcata]
MHPQLSLLRGLHLAILSGTSVAFVVPKSEPNGQDIAKVTTGVSSDTKTTWSTPIYYRSPDWSAQPSRNNKEREEGAQETHFAYIADGTNIKARESTEEHGGIYRRDGGSSNNTIIIVVAVLVGLLFVGIAVITWRKFQGY